MDLEQMKLVAELLKDLGGNAQQVMVVYFIYLFVKLIFVYTTIGYLILSVYRLIKNAVNKAYINEDSYEQLVGLEKNSHIQRYDFGTHQYTGQSRLIKLIKVGIQTMQKAQAIKDKDKTV